MLHIIHGADEYGRAQETARLRARVMSAGLGDLNVTQLDGRKVVLSELLNDCSTLPFLTERRLIIVEGLVKRVSKGEGSQPKPGGELATLLAYLPHLPASTDLALVEDELLPPKHPLLALAKQLEGARVVACQPLDLSTPAGRTQLQRWAAERCQALGVTIAAPALALLFERVGPDRRVLDGELQKLAANVGYRGEITSDQVRTLVPASIEANIFALVDALGQRRARAALDELERLLANGANELYILTMIARQVRLLIGVQELRSAGASREAIGERLGVRHKFALDKLLSQAPQFRAEELDQVMERIAQTDEEIKTGKMDPPLALELLVLRICQRAAPRQ
ncbi:MAG: DNA polymerase III subunit delta [Anaerolineales bacterium]